jgi:hypothetical protein
MYPETTVDLRDDYHSRESYACSTKLCTNQRGINGTQSNKDKLKYNRTKTKNVNIRATSDQQEDLQKKLHTNYVDLTQN